MVSQVVRNIFAVYWTVRFITKFKRQYPNPDESSPHTHTHCVCKIISLLSSKWGLPFNILNVTVVLFVTLKHITISTSWMCFPYMKQVEKYKHFCCFHLPSYGLDDVFVNTFKHPMTVKNSIVFLFIMRQ